MAYGTEHRKKTLMNSKNRRTREKQKKMTIKRKSPKHIVLRALELVRSKGVEPLTFRFVAECSIQLSYERISIR
jgi:hypothetical protein